MDLRAACWGETQWGCRRLLTHINGLPPDSALARKRLNAPMGWDNSVELLASVVDAIQALTRLYINVHSESPIDPIPLMPRPYGAPVEPVRPNTISLAEFGDLLKETT